MNADGELEAVDRPVALYQCLKSKGVRQMSYVPDAGHTTLIKLFNEDDDVSTGQFSFCDSRGGEKARVLIVNTSGRPRLSETTRTGDVPP